MEADIQFKSVSDDNMEACIRLKEEVGGVVHCLQRELAANGGEGLNSGQSLCYLRWRPRGRLYHVRL